MDWRDWIRRNVRQRTYFVRLGATVTALFGLSLASAGLREAGLMIGGFAVGLALASCIEATPPPS